MRLAYLEPSQSVRIASAEERKCEHAHERMRVITAGHRAAGVCCAYWLLLCGFFLCVFRIRHTRLLPLPPSRRNRTRRLFGRAVSRSVTAAPHCTALHCTTHFHRPWVYSFPLFFGSSFHTCRVYSGLRNALGGRNHVSMDSSGSEHRLDISSALGAVDACRMVVAAHLPQVYVGAEDKGAAAHQI